MAKSFNQVILLGNLANDPELRTTTTGKSVVSFSIATNRSWSDKSGERQERADFHNIVAWEKLGELCNQYLSKGRKAMVVGRLQTRSWEGDDGKKRYRTEVVASDVSFLDSPGGQSSPDSTTPKKKSSNKKQGEEEKEDEPVTIEDLGDDPVDLSEIPF